MTCFLGFFSYTRTCRKLLCAVDCEHLLTPERFGRIEVCRFRRR